MTRLADAGRTVLLETSGAVDIAPVDPPGPRDPRPEDPRLGRGRRRTSGATSPCSSRGTRSSSSSATAPTSTGRSSRCVAHDLTDRCPVLFSPAFGQVNPTDLAAWILETRLPVRLQIQLHKILWDPTARGV